MKNRHKQFFGMFLVVFGTLLLLSQFGIVMGLMGLVMKTFSLLAKLAVVWVGTQLLKNRQTKNIGLITTLFGLLWIFSRIYSFSLWGVFVPILIIFWGIRVFQKG